MSATVNTRDYYLQYFGHPISDLHTLHGRLRQNKSRPCIFLAGDSSLDNKVWFEARSHALNGYEEILNPPTMKLDVCY